jgi:hypothetical protein
MASRALDPGRSRSALERFAEKCRFDATTGCVIWIGGTSCGQLKTAKYPVFWDEGRRWFGHRWSAKNIHGLDIEGLQVDHCCPNIPIPNTLCIQHVQAVTQLVNLELQWGRRLWGWDEWREPDPVEADPNAIPFHLPPAWLCPFLPPSPMEPF